MKPTPKVTRGDGPVCSNLLLGMNANHNQSWAKPQFLSAALSATAGLLYSGVMQGFHRYAFPCSIHKREAKKVINPIDVNRNDVRPNKDPKQPH